MSKSATPGVAFDDYGYVHQVHGYRVLKAPGATPLTAPYLMDGDWNPVNLDSDSRGKPKQRDEASDLTTYQFDTDSDGDTDASEQGFLADLSFRHRLRDGEVRLRTMPLSSELRDKELRVHAYHYVDAVSGAGYQAGPRRPLSSARAALRRRRGVARSCQGGRARRLRGDVHGRQPRSAAGDTQRAAREGAPGAGAHAVRLSGSQGRGQRPRILPRC